MPKVKILSFSVSADGYGAGPKQDLQNPLGVGGTALHEWFFGTRTFHEMRGQPGGGSSDVDETFAARGFENIGAWILGRNMFGPIRGPWADESWQGWWGETPPYKVPVFVLTHHARPSLEMKGGTVFHFITGGIEVALAVAKKAAKEKDVRIGGGVSVLRQFIQANLVDEMHFAVSPVFLGNGENLFSGLNLPAQGYQVTERLSSPQALHVVLKK